MSAIIHPFWSEGTRAYRLHPSVHSIAGLVQLADQQR